MTTESNTLGPGLTMCQISIATRVVGQAEYSRTLPSGEEFLPKVRWPQSESISSSVRRGCTRLVSDHAAATSAVSVAFDSCVPQQISIDTYVRPHHFVHATRHHLTQCSLH